MSRKESFQTSKLFHPTTITSRTLPSSIQNRLSCPFIAYPQTSASPITHTHRGKKKKNEDVKKKNVDTHLICPLLPVVRRQLHLCRTQPLHFKQSWNLTHLSSALFNWQRDVSSSQTCAVSASEANEGTCGRSS